MYQKNIVTNIAQYISIDSNVEVAVKDMLKDVGNINSFIVYGKYDDDRLEGWQIHYNVSQNAKFNVIKVDDVLNKLSNELYKSINGEKKYVICHMQPPVELLIKLFKPLIIKLAKEQNERWQYLEMEDLIQMCNLVICDLYYKGYYIHKQLIRRAYINYVLMHIRKDKNKPTVMSLHQEYNKSDDDERVTLEDMIPDTSMVDGINDKYDCEVNKKVLEEVKEIVIDFIGRRQYDQLLREYGNKSTTNWSRKLMTTIKAHLFEMGINIKSFNKYYN